jgi:ABC-type nickel/cobalt efflux system permease component RcnA
MHSHTHELSLGLSFFLGALHALEPGHGKTAMFVYLLDGRRSFWHPIVMGLSTAVSHSISLFAIALGVHLAHHVISGDHDHEGQVSEALQWISAMLVVAVGGFLMVQALRGRTSDCCGHDHADHHRHHSTDGDHHPCRNNPPTNNSLPSPLVQLGGISPTSTLQQHKAAEVTDTLATTTSQTADRSAFDGSSPDQLKHGQSTGFRTTAILGLAVGLLPCPTAMAACFAGLSSGSPATTYLIIGLFAAGIACSLSLTGIILQYFGERFGRRSAALAKLPWNLIRSVLILGIGMVYMARLIFDTSV